MRRYSYVFAFLAVSSLAACAHKPAPEPAKPAPVVEAPPPAKVVPPAAHVRMTDKAIEIDEKVQFELGKAVLLPASDGLLGEVADVIKQHTEIASVQVEGYTSSEGKLASNRKLSQDRADAVKAWLVAHGVEATRLAAKGFGPDKPIAPNDTEENREKNRRVEFKIAPKP